MISNTVAGRRQADPIMWQGTGTAGALLLGRWIYEDFAS